MYAQQEFGSKTFYRWVESVQEMEDRLRKNPRSYSRVLELIDEPRKYRGHIVMKNFKIIYTCDEKHFGTLLKNINNYEYFVSNSIRNSSMLITETEGNGISFSTLKW